MVWRLLTWGGETADVGDLVRTIAVNGTMTARWPKNKIISNEKISPGDVIVGLASFGQAVYENEYNSGIGSNGLTSARHDLISSYYKTQYPETFEPALPDDVVYIGPHQLTDSVSINYRGEELQTTIGKLILSPTRTFAPVVRQMLENEFEAIHGLIHCSGGGQTKCMKYMPENVRVIKDNLFNAPEVFRLIQKSSGADQREMYQVFNMGCRLEIYTHEKNADRLVSISEKFGIEAKLIGRVEAAEEKSLLLKVNGEEISYS